MKGRERGFGGKGEGIRRHPQPPPPPQQRQTPRPLPPKKSRHALTQPESEVNNEHHNGTRTGRGGEKPRNPNKTDKEFPKMKEEGREASSGVALALGSVPGQARGRLLLLLL